MKIRILAKRRKEGVFTSKTQKLKITRSSITKTKNRQNQAVFAASFHLKNGYKNEKNQEFEKNKILNFRQFPVFASNEYQTQKIKAIVDTLHHKTK